MKAEKSIVESDVNKKQTRDKEKSVYDYDQILEDDILRLIMNPQDTPDNVKNVIALNDTQMITQRQKEIDKGYKSIMEKRHPNTLVFDKNDRLFVGDNNGQIHVWKLFIKGSEVMLLDPYVIKHKEIEGD